MLHSLKQIYPTVDIASHIVGDPITVSWEDDPNFMGAGQNPDGTTMRGSNFVGLQEADACPQAGPAGITREELAVVQRYVHSRGALPDPWQFAVRAGGLLPRLRWPDHPLGQPLGGRNPLFHALFISR